MSDADAVIDGLDFKHSAFNHQSSTSATEEQAATSANCAYSVAPSDTSDWREKKHPTSPRQLL